MLGDGSIEEILEACAAGGFELSGRSGAHLAAFLDELDRWSTRIHLVGKRDRRQTVRAQVLDSLQMLRFAEKCGALGKEWERGGGMRADSGAPPCADAAASEPAPEHVADIGAGAGFPGIVWKIARPDIDITLFERREKPARFLEHVITRLGLPDTRTSRTDASKYSGEAMFDLVVSKAAGRLGALLPLAEGLLRSGGAYITVKGKGWDREIEEAPPGNLFLREKEDVAGGRGTMILFRFRR